MENKIKNIIITVVFVVIVFAGFLINVIVKDKEISTSERRKLEQFPKITLDKLLSGDTTSKLEKYTTDQFVARDTFRAIKSFFNTKIYNQQDNNKLFEKDGALYKMEYPLNENNVNKSLDKIFNVYNRYLKDKNMNIYYSIIPDKNYYLENDNHLKMDYNKLLNIASTKLNNFTYIDIFNDLSLEDYYKTDLHWKQENLSSVVSRINLSLSVPNNSIQYTTNNLGAFYGTYYGQLLSNVKPDILYTLTNDTINGATTYNYETKKYGNIYSSTTSADRYDTYLSGAVSLIRIDNPNCNTNKELLIFRDSFSSSLAPLLIQNYSKITLIDLRYISSSLLDQYIDFNNQDVLFIYSTLILNQNVLK